MNKKGKIILVTNFFICILHSDYIKFNYRQLLNANWALMLVLSSETSPVVITSAVAAGLVTARPYLLFESGQIRFFLLYPPVVFAEVAQASN